MNEKFLELSEEKQMRIINAGFEVFSQNEYKRASTDEIARIADISKGLLFYYFHNKKALYMFLYEYANRLITDNIANPHLKEITDFFELCEYAAKQKQELLSKMPYLMNFFIKAYYSQKEDVSSELNQKIQRTVSSIFDHYFKNIDVSKFKPEINPQDILQMLTWMADGYIHEQQRKDTYINVDEFMTKYKQWSALLKQSSYKEEN